jgi:hypothetical protein
MKGEEMKRKLTRLAKLMKSKEEKTIKFSK